MMRGSSALAQAICLVAVLVSGIGAAPSENPKAALKFQAGTTPGPAAAAIQQVKQFVTTGAPAQLNKLKGSEELKADLGTTKNTGKLAATTTSSVVKHHEATKVTAAAPAKAHISSKPIVAGAASSAPTITPAQRISQYFEPVCSHLERLEPQQLFKIQSQLKQFVGKVSLSLESFVQRPCPIVCTRSRN